MNDDIAMRGSEQDLGLHFLFFWSKIADRKTDKSTWSQVLLKVRET